MTFLGVETSELPTVVADQLGLAKGFGLVVDYVVPNGPAAAAGVQQNDILKMLNDQILMGPDQLAKLIRSYPEGTSVTLTILRKGAETKLTATLAKRDVTQRPDFKGWKGHDFGQLDGMDLGGMLSGIGETARQEIQNAQREAQQAAREAAREGREAAREARNTAREAAREFRVTRSDDGALRTTHIDMNKAQIVYHDAGGELKIENVTGKRILTAKDPQGRTVFSGPVETKEELEKLPAEVRQRYEKLEQKDLPALAPEAKKTENRPADAEDEDVDDDENDSGASGALFEVTSQKATSVPFRRFGYKLLI